MLTFLLQHPKINGYRQEIHWHDTGDFNRDLKAFLGHMGQRADKNKKSFLEPGKAMILKMDNTPMWKMADDATHIEPSIGLGFIMNHSFRASKSFES